LVEAPYVEMNAPVVTSEAKNRILPYRSKPRSRR
jgi:hypothetical protein